MAQVMYKLVLLDPNSGVPADGDVPEYDPDLKAYTPGPPAGGSSVTVTDNGDGTSMLSWS